eukprot:CAMPEP_0176441932 /NCGR_PEP_ID=MMETSP0127-20121128/21510_1 /TAXON_ID=938130 /ORGANISM="Platyophrya macrostoma, Strain WH" /LENGTH=466 /DNA_ID=CAMNT_0017826841 /DNA_START=178 /DNA_END=1578 /DNA_ORIENTATION=-
MAINRIAHTSSTGQPSKNPEEEEEFHVVEAKVAGKKTGPTANKFRRNINPNIIQPKQVPLSDPSHPQNRQKGTYGQKPGYNRGGYGQRTMTSKTKFKDNAGVQGDWVHISEVQKSNFDKIKIYSEKVNDIVSIGSIKAYDRAVELRATPKKEVPIPIPTGSTITASTDTTEDKVIIEEIEKDLNRGGENLMVYTTDQILSAILTLKNSVFPWEVHVTKIKNQIIFDLFEKDKVSYIDLLTVNENTSGNLPEEEKDMIKLCVEATNVNKNFITTAATGPQKSFGEDNPHFKSNEKKVFRYRRWELDRIEVVVRSEVDAYLPPKDENQDLKYVKLCALNEYELGTDWRGKLENNRGALISTECRNNSCKLSRWICQAFLADIDEVKIAFITRQNQKDASKHSILNVESYSLNSLVSMINYKLKDNWAILKGLVEILGKQEDGEYALVKQAYKQSIKIYRIPQKEGEDA